MVRLPAGSWQMSVPNDNTSRGTMDNELTILLLEQITVNVQSQMS